MIQISNQSSQEEMIATIILISQELLKSSHTEKTDMGTIISITGNKAIVKIYGENYTCGIKDGITISVGDICLVRSIQDEYSYKYIDGKLL